MVIIILVMYIYVSGNGLLCVYDWTHNSMEVPKVSALSFRQLNCALSGLPSARQ